MYCHAISLEQVWAPIQTLLPTLPASLTNWLPAYQLPEEWQYNHAHMLSRMNFLFLSFSIPRAVDLAVSRRFNKGKLGKRGQEEQEDKAILQITLTLSIQLQWHHSNFPASQTPTKQSSPSHFSKLFRCKSKDIKRLSSKPSPRGSLDHTNYDNPAAKQCIEYM